MEVDVAMATTELKLWQYEGVVTVGMREVTIVAAHNVFCGNLAAYCCDVVWDTLQWNCGGQKWQDR